MTRPTLRIIQGGLSARPRSLYPRDDLAASQGVLLACALSAPFYAAIGVVVWWAFWSGAYRP